MLEHLIRNIEEGIRETWSTFIEGFDGKVFSGPLSTLVQLSQTLGWEITRELKVITRANLSIDLARASWSEVETIFLDSWWQALTDRIRERDEFAGLDGFSSSLSSAESWIHDSSQLALLRSCQDGTFATESAKAHWDLSRAGTCRFCAEPDTLRHRLQECPQHQQVRSQHSRLMRIWPSLPDCQRLHGLCPRVSGQQSYWVALQQLPDLTSDFAELDPGTDHANLFLDGTCAEGDVPELALAAWAVTTSTQPLATGPLIGIRQTIARAEITACIAALRWISRTKKMTHIWTDSQLVFDGVTALRDGRAVDFEDTDLWEIVDDLVSCCSSWFTIHKIWSHMSKDWAREPFEDWWIEGNHLADRSAAWANVNRSSDFCRLREEFLRDFRWAKTVTRLCHEYILAIAEAHPAVPNEEAVEETMLSELVPPDDSQVCQHEIAAQFPRALLTEVSLSPTAVTYGRDIVRSMSSWLVACDQIAATSRGVAFLELYVGWMLTTGLSTPVYDHFARKWISPEESFCQAFPATLAAQMAVFRRMLLGIASDFGVEMPIVEVDLRSCFVLRKIPGIHVGWPTDLSAKVWQVLRNFFRDRPWRSGVDIAKPLRVDRDEELCFVDVEFD